MIKKDKALEILKAMSDKEFMSFFNSLPPRVRLLVCGGVVDWQKALPAWYIEINKITNHE